ncbi:MAG: hypothetical protein JST50_07915 [Bacteroidetes bacterium]|nr:hypothetical protein [Bacteroidota bacterium]
MSDRFKYVGLIILFNLSIAYGHGAGIDTSKLPKYSYLIYGYSSSGSCVQATGFFVSKRNRTYLVTACHVINGWLFESFDKKESYPDTLFVKTELKNTQRDTSLAIDISKLKYIKADPNSDDIYFIPINIPPGCEIYRLDSLILNFTPITAIPKEVLAYGFIVGDDELSSKQFFKMPSLPNRATVYIPDWDAYSCSPLVYELGYSGADLGPGNSGAPVYFITGNSDDAAHLQFGGLLFGGNQTKHRALVIRPELVKVLYDEL